MGHKRKSCSPSPIKLLSIFDARRRGIPLPEIAKRTTHSISSIMRWTEKYGHEADFYQLMIQKVPELQDTLKFETLYPEHKLTPIPPHSPEMEEFTGDQMRVEQSPVRKILF